MPYYSAEEMKKVLDEYPQYRDKLYCRGFLLTNGDDADLSEYPFYGNWSKQELCGGCSLYLHRDAAAYTYTEGAAQYFLIGHAYDPFNMKWDENELLKDIAAAKENGDEAFWDAVSNFTGVFCIGYIENGKVIYATDCCGMQLVNHGAIDGKLYITSHAKLAADLCGLEQDEYVKQYISTRTYHFYGVSLPADLSPYKELKRLVPNFFGYFDGAAIENKRFYPTEAIRETQTEEEYRATIHELGEIMSRTMHLIAEKWSDKKVSLAVTGGRDSLTALACAKSVYDRLEYFSYISNGPEAVDAEAAHGICRHLNLEHEIYTIPEDSEDYPELPVFKKIMECNAGCIGENNLNDLKKRLWFVKHPQFDIEIKSWVNEMGRDEYHNRYNKKSFPQRPTPGIWRTIHKICVNPSVIRKTDEVYKDYLERFCSDGVYEMLPWIELYSWEFAWSAGNGLFLTAEHRVSYEITIPFNNRRYVEKMLTVPVDKRISDSIPFDLISERNGEIVKAADFVKNVEHTNIRALMERTYFEIFSRLRF